LSSIASTQELDDDRARVRSAQAAAVSAEAQVAAAQAAITAAASTAQFTPKTVETASERQKLMFRVKAQIDRALLQKNLKQIKTGLPGVAWIKLDARAPWPVDLTVKVPH
jgi:HlyD family secretion protein